MSVPAVRVESWDPEGKCPKCGSGPHRSTYHERAVAIVFGPNPQYPCAPGGTLGEHLCAECPECGYRWVEEMPPGGFSASEE